jgi:hypothetical protein
LTNRKSQNSILFLTTLGVYLGLVLVGVTPQVLAQAATAKQFSVKDEIERRDDLDDDPRGCTGPDHERIRELEATFLWFNHSSIVQYRDVVESLIDAYSKVAAYKVGWKSVGEFRPDREITPTTNVLIADADDFDYKILDLGNTLPGKSFSLSTTKDASGYSFRFESINFWHDTPLVRYLYGAAFDFYRCSDNGTEVEDVVLRHTEVKVEGRNLIITTRLPRGSLDSLLATDAK